MINLAQEFVSISNKAVDKKIKILEMEVIFINELDYTCTLRGDGYLFTSVPLQNNLLNNSKGFILIPKLQSFVYVLVKDDIKKTIINTNEIDKVIINTEKEIYLNTTAKTSPIVKGDILKSHIDKIYDYLKYIVDMLAALELEDTTKPSTLTFDLPFVPLMLQRQAELIAKGVLIESDKATVDNIKSTKNFTG